MEIKTLAASKVSGPPTLGLKTGYVDKRNPIFSPSETMSQIWKSQRSKSRQEGEILLRNKKETTAIARKALHRNEEQFSSTKSSVSHRSRDNSAKATKNRQREFNEKLKRAMLTSDSSNKQRPARDRRNEKSPLRLVGQDRYLFKIRQKFEQKQASLPKEVLPKPSPLDCVWRRGDSLCYNENINIKLIIEKIFYEGFSTDALEDFLAPAFNRIKDEESYIRTVLSESKTLAKIIKGLILRKITGLAEGPADSATQEPRFRKFRSNSARYVSAIEAFANYYKIVEQINNQFAALHLHFDNFMGKANGNDWQDSQTTNTNIIKKIFLRCLFRERDIHSFVEHIFIYFRDNRDAADKFYGTFENIKQIYESFEIISKKQDDQGCFERFEAEQSESKDNSCISNRDLPVSAYLADNLFHPENDQDLENNTVNATTQELTECETQQTVYTVDSVLGNEQDGEKKKKKKKNKKKKKQTGEDTSQMISILEYTPVLDILPRSLDIELPEELRHLDDLISSIKVPEHRKQAVLSKKALHEIDKIFKQILSK